jgi:hypothetical protein
VLVVQVLTPPFLPFFTVMFSPANYTALGVRPVDFVSQFSAGVAVAATWDHDHFYQRAKEMGDEFRGKGVHIFLGPVTGGPLGRSPLMGRNWEGESLLCPTFISYLLNLTRLIPISILRLLPGQLP